MRFLPKEVNAFLLTWASYLLMKVQTTAKKTRTMEEQDGEI